MDISLMKDFEELEGLADQQEEVEVDDKEDEDASFRPVQASTLSSADIYYEMDKRHLKTTGFPDTDREILQKAFDAEFLADLEEAKAKRREQKRRAAQQAGLQKRRMMMEKFLQEEQDELAKNHQVSTVIGLIKDNNVESQMRIEVNSISARTLAKALWTNTSVTCIDLSSNELNDHAGSYLARILKKNTTLRKIELDNNRLGSKSIGAFGESLKVNSTLVYLSLDSNPLCDGETDSEVRKLADALRINKTMRSLNLWRTGLGPLAGSALASGIEQNSTLLFFDIGHNAIDMSDVKLITDKLDANVLAYENRERKRIEDSLSEAERSARAKAIADAERNQIELAQWLEMRREERAEARRKSQEDRILEAAAELEEQKRRAAEEAKAAAKAAAEKEAAKAAKGKGKKK